VKDFVFRDRDRLDPGPLFRRKQRRLGLLECVVVTLRKSYMSTDFPCVQGAVSIPGGYSPSLS
jgi:hypothetical protein